MASGNPTGYILSFEFSGEIALDEDDIILLRDYFGDDWEDELGNEIAEALGLGMRELENDVTFDDFTLIHPPKFKTA